MVRRRLEAEIACAQVDPEIFFPQADDRAKIAVAKAYCRRCLVRIECLEGAFQERDQHSVRGGLTANERTALVRSEPSRATGGRAPWR